MASAVRFYELLPIVRDTTLFLYRFLHFDAIFSSTIVEVSSAIKLKENADSEAPNLKKQCSSSSALSSFLSSLNTAKASPNPVAKKPQSSKGFKPLADRLSEQCGTSSATSSSVSAKTSISQSPTFSTSFQQDARGLSAPTDEDTTAGALTSGTLHLLVELLRAFTNADRDGRFVCTWTPTAAAPAPGSASTSPSSSTGRRPPQATTTAANNVLTRREAPVPTAAATLKYILLNPLEHIADVVRQARSFILAGGTMQPVRVVIFTLLPLIYSLKTLMDSNCYATGRRTETTASRRSQFQ